MKYLPMGLGAIFDVSKPENEPKKILEKVSLFFYPFLNSGLGHNVLFTAVMSANTELSFNLFWQI